MAVTRSPRHTFDPPPFRGGVIPMDSQRSPLGVCPNCEAVVPSEWLLIEYQTADDTTVYAECPDCGNVGVLQ